MDRPRNRARGALDSGDRPPRRPGQAPRPSGWGPARIKQGQLLTVLQPRTLDDALALRAERQDALVVAGGTGVLVELNRGLEPSALLDLSRVPELRETAEANNGGALRLGATTTYTDVLERHAEALPGLAAAARTVASRQVRNRATLAGALALGDPSSDALAALGAAEAIVEVAGPRGIRHVAVEHFVTGPGACDLALDELVTALVVPIADGPTAYAKAGARNAMARAVCGVAIELHPVARTATVCVVGAAPTAIRPATAEALVADAWEDRDDQVSGRFGALVAEAVDPLPDARGSTAYRRHVAGVLARRALDRAWDAL
jgi:CO/xanthine dehydrogenase FAD-binding subunit